MVLNLVSREQLLRVRSVALFRSLVQRNVSLGLGWTAIHPAAASVLLPKDFFVPPSPGALSSLFATLTLRSTAPAKDDLHSFSIVARMLKDAALDPTSDFKVTEGDEDADNIEATLQSSQGKIILNYASLWHIDPTVPGELDKKLEELSWLMVLIYGVGGWKKGRDFRADFFT